MIYTVTKRSEHARGGRGKDMPLTVEGYDASNWVPAAKRHYRHEVEHWLSGSPHVSMGIYIETAYPGWPAA